LDGNWRCLDHIDRGKQLEAHDVTLRMGKLWGRLLVAALVGIFGSLGGIYMQMSGGQHELMATLSHTNEAIAGIKERQASNREEIGRLRTRVDSIEVRRAP